MFTFKINGLVIFSLVLISLFLSGCTEEIAYYGDETEIIPTDSGLFQMECNQNLKVDTVTFKKEMACFDGTTLKITLSNNGINSIEGFRVRATGYQKETLCVDENVTIPSKKSGVLEIELEDTGYDFIEFYPYMTNQKGSEFGLCDEIYSRSIELVRQC